MAGRCLNRIMLVGNLTRDPELKYTPAGTAICTFGLATNRSWTTSKGEQREEVQYHRIVAWQKLAELCGKILSKGDKVYVEGRLTYRTFTGRDNQQKTIAEIVLDDFIVFGPKKKIAEQEKESITTERVEPEELENEAVPIEEDTLPKEEVITKTTKETNNKKNVTNADTNEEKINEDDIPF